MVQGYHTLQEAAKVLGMPVDELKQMAQKGQIRSFQDRGTLRFRIQDIQELARKRGGTSDPDLVLGDASLPPAKSGGAPSSGSRKSAPPKSPAKQASAPDVFDFDMDTEHVDLGEGLIGPGSNPKNKPSSKGKKPAAPVGSDSDVRLVADGSDVSFTLPKEDSDVRITPDSPRPRTGSTPPPSSGPKRQSQLALESGTHSKGKLGTGSSAAKASSPRPGQAPQPVDSGVRLVPMDDDSDVKLHGSADDVPLGEGSNPSATDSNVRLEKVSLPTADSGENDLMLTEEINLDEELRKEREKKKNEPSTKLKPKSQLKLPTTSPFELSDSDLELPSELKGPKTPKVAKVSEADSSDFDLAAQSSETADGSSDFDLIPSKDGSILLEESHDSDFSLEPGEGVLDQDQETDLTSASSGISLNNPVDAGISLEESGEDAGDFDLSLEVEDTPKPRKSRPADDSDSEFEISTGKTPKKKKAKPADDSDSEFDLSLDAEDSASQADSEFDLNLEGSGELSAGESSDSEFELTLDDSGGLAVAEEDEPAPQMKSKAKAKPKSKKPSSSDEQDIFETDFEVPALDGSDDASATDSELESSDFDLALDDSELANEEESGSQVVALDEEDAGADGGAAVDDVEVEDESSDFADLDDDVEVDDEAAVDDDEETEAAGKGPRETVIKEKLIPAAPWGVLPVIFMLPCVVIMFLVGILGYELVQTTTGLKPPGPLTVAIGGQIGVFKPTDFK